jgi:hypothetical protein
MRVLIDEPPVRRTTVPLGRPFFKPFGMPVAVDRCMRDLLDDAFSPRRQPEATYLRHATTQPWTLCLFALSAALGLLMASFPLFLLDLGVVALFLVVLAQVPSFRRLVDGRVATARRAELVARMDECHRRELQSLERLAREVRDNVRSRGAAAVLACEDCLGLDRLLASYVRLALQHKAGKDALDAADRRTLAAEMSTLEHAPRGSSERLRRLEQRRLALAQERAAWLERAEENVQTMAHHLATIGDLIRLMHDRARTVTDSIEIEQFLFELREHEQAMDGLAAWDLSAMRELTDFDEPERSPLLSAS